MEDKDTGLGLTDFLATPQTQESEEETPVVEEVNTETEVKEEKTEEKAEEVKPEEAQAEDVQPEAKPDEKPSWEADDNPYKKRHADAAKWANQTHQQNLALQKQLDIINKKLDGTYDPEAEAKANQVPPEAIAQTSETVGRIVSSREAAYEIHGKDKVNALLFAEGAPFKQIENLPQVEHRVLNSPSPVLEAMKIVEEYAFYQKWGATPKAIEDNIKKAYEKEIEDRVTKKILEKVSMKEGQPHGISAARGIVSGSTQTPTQTPPLAEIFDGR